MTEDKVRDLLSRYSANKGRAARLEAEIGKLEAEAKQLRAMEADTLKATALDGMPRRKGGKSDPTGRKGTQLADGEALSKEEARITAKISANRADLSQLKLDISLVEGWLGALMDRERLIIRQQLVQKRSWRETAAEYARAFGDEMSEDTLRRMRDRAVAFIAAQM